MKKIFLILSILVSFNAFSMVGSSGVVQTSNEKLKLIAFTQCAGNNYDGQWTRLESCINQYLKRGFEIIGTRSTSVPNNGQVFIDMALFVRE